MFLASSFYLSISFCRFAVGARRSPQSAADGHSNRYANPEPDRDVSRQHPEGYAERCAQRNS